MKQLGRVIGSVLAVVLTVFSLQALAETTTTLAGRDFNHMTTGFPLLGGHATAACETCHVAGVFKGTAKTCEGCHSLGKRVVATPKSTGHIVTDAPCETCHFNTSTFLGARFNHATAQPGQCMTCHNGRQSASRPGSHMSGKKATDSCDHCHRTYAWTPASWNHIGVVPGTCDSAGCHVSGANQYFRSGATHTRTGMATYACDDCHNFFTWNPAHFKHNRGGTCSSCHLNGAVAAGQPTSHNSFIGWPTDCSECHTSTISWLGALGAKPANHIPYNAGVACTSCHSGTAVRTGATLHAFVTSYTCNNCHQRNAQICVGACLGNIQTSSHKGSQTCNSGGCHSSYTTWNR